MERLTFDGKFCDIAQCGEIKSMQEEHFSGLEMAKLHSALIELKKYQEADEEGRLAVLPCAVGGAITPNDYCSRAVSDKQPRASIPWEAD